MSCRRCPEKACPRLSPWMISYWIAAFLSQGEMDSDMVRRRRSALACFSRGIGRGE